MKMHVAGRWLVVVLAAAGGAPAFAADKILTEVFKPGGGSEKLFHSFPNAGAITINDNAPATPYPSNIVVAGQVGTLNEAAVIIQGLTHTFPDDLDMMLVSPAGTRVMLQSDAGGSFGVSALTYVIGNSQTFDGFVHIPDSAVITNRSYLPADYESGLEIMPAPAPAGVYYVSTFAFNGENPNGTWSLYVRDDFMGFGGTIASGWRLSLDINDRNVVTTIPGAGTSGPAGPYPAPITVLNNTAYGRISKLRVVLSNVSHTFPDDIDVLLQGPDGQKVLLMSDVGGSFDLTGQTFTFAQGAPLMPDNALIPTGTYAPTNSDNTTDTFPAPAPTGPYGNSLSVWNNTRPNGTWNLWVRDDVVGDVGSVGNWALEITTVEKGDFDRDANIDLLWRHDVSGENVLWYMEGSTLFQGQFTNPTALVDPGWNMVGTHDFNGDRKNDILWRHNVSGENVVWFMNKNVMIGGAYLTPPALADTNWKMAGTGDFNNDAKPDILWRHDVSGGNVVWFMDDIFLTAGEFLNPSVLADTNWKMVGTGYFNGDVQLDILWWHQLSGQIVVWFMNGTTLTTGEFTTPNGLTDTNWRPVATGDINRDGRVDIIWRHQVSGENVVWFMGGANGTTLLSGTLTTPPTLVDPNWKIVGPR